MKITETIDLRIHIADIETIKVLFSAGFYNPDIDEWNVFEISEFRNDLYEFVSFYHVDKLDRCVWFNGIGFDCQVIEYILRNYNQWANLSNLQIVDKIYNYAQAVIENKNYGNFAEFRETEFSVPCFDVYTILGLDNAMRYTSLKKCEFNLDMLSVEEMPIHHSVEKLSKEEIEQTISYMKTDIKATYEVFKLCLGDTNHNLYKGNNQLDLRFSIKEEFGIECLNYSDIKIGDELMKKSYVLAKGIEVKDLPKKGTFRKSISLKSCIPKYVEFKTPKLQKILKDLKNKTVVQNSSHEINFNYGAFNTEYIIGLGGGHSKNDGQIWQQNEQYFLIDLDVQSLYPAIFVNEGLYPAHLGKELLNVYKKLYERRLELKPLAKKDKKIAGIVGAIKLILNSFYGKVGSMESWSYDKKVPYSICLTGQLNLLMLIEEMEINNIPCFSFNTDGATFKVKKENIDKFYEINKQWEQKTNLLLEEQRFDKMYYSTINDYLAITTDGKIKLKGDFLTDLEIYKNKSWRVVALAIYEYFVNGKDPIQFIKNHKNIFDFCIMARASGQLHLEMQKESEDGTWSSENIQKLKKLLRYYLTTDKEWQLFKRGIGSTGKKANIGSHADNELGAIFVKYYNQHVEMEDYKIDYNQYIYKALKIIDKVLRTNKLKSFIESQKPSQQISMF